MMTLGADISEIIFATAVLLLAGVFASKVSFRLGIPALLLFMGLGMAAGSEGPGGIPFDDPWTAQFIGIVALAFILFDGGLETDKKVVAKVLWRGLSLATLGVFLTAALVGAFASAVFGFSYLEGFLLGCIVSSTDAAAVFAVLRSNRVGLKGSTKPLLELESGSNDPMAVFLTMAVISLLGAPDKSWLSVVPMFALQMGVGAVVGIVGGKGLSLLLSRLKLESDGLYPVLTIASVLFIYGVAAVMGGSGFLSVYLAGIILGNSDFIHKRSLIQFHSGLAWLVQIGMFLVLGLLVFPSHLLPVTGAALAISLFLIFVARPLAVFTSLSFTDLRFPHKLLVSWIGLRGAVPIVLATFPYLAQLPGAELYFNVVFFIVLTSVLLQGTTLTRAARLLGLDAPLPRHRRHPMELLSVGASNSDLIKVVVGDLSAANGKRVMDLGLPETAIVVLVVRGDHFIAPRGGTTVVMGDRLLVVTDKKDIEAVQALIENPQASGE